MDQAQFHEAFVQAESFTAKQLIRTSPPSCATFHELWEIALVLEPLAAQLAAGNASDADLEELEENVRTTENLLRHGPAQPEQFDALIALDMSFHALIARISGNRALMVARESVSLLYNPTMTQLQLRLPQAHTRNCVAHRHIFNEVRRQDSDKAESWMRKHLVDYQRGYVLARLDMDLDIELNNGLPYAV